MPEEGHDFDNTIVAILDEEPAVQDAAQGLAASGYDFEVLSGEEGRAHIHPGSEDGVMPAVKRLLKAFGDQHRIIDRLDDALQQGKVVVSVEMDDDEPGDAISILKDHGGHYIWKLGDWTFTRIGD